MKDTDQITAEAADAIYERYINQKQWTKTGTLTQGEFIAMMIERIKSAIEKAYREGYCDGGSASRKEDIARFLPLVKQEIAAHANDQVTGQPYCDIHQHFRWCEHNGGVMGPSGWGPPEKS